MCHILEKEAIFASNFVVLLIMHKLKAPEDMQIDC